MVTGKLRYYFSRTSLRDGPLAKGADRLPGEAEARRSVSLSSHSVRYIARQLPFCELRHPVFLRLFVSALRVHAKSTDCVLSMRSWLPSFAYVTPDKGYWDPVTSTLNWVRCNPLRINRAPWADTTPLFSVKR